MHITEITPTIQKKTEKTRLAPYCRVSSDSADQLHSFAAQIRYYSDFAKRHPDYELVDIYADEGLTGTDMSKRDELNRLLRDCKLGKVDRIIVKSVSRFARNTEELLVTLRMLKEIGVSVYFEEQGIDTNKLNSEMIVTFPGMAAQQESEAISGNVRWSTHRRMQTGEYNGTYPAYGYEMENGKLVIKEAEAEVVRFIFTMYLQGYGSPAITRMLNDKGIPRRFGRSKWYNGTVAYILTNERYMGDALLQKKYRTEDLARKSMRNKGEKEQYYVENSHPPIISREMFTSAQALMKTKSTEKTKRASYPLTGTMKCPECGNRFRRQELNGKTYWICNGRASGYNQCKSRRVQEDMVYEAFVSMTHKLTDHREYLLGMLIAQIEQLQSRTSQNQTRIREIDKELADLGARNLVITKLHTSGIEVVLTNDIGYYKKRKVRVLNGSHTNLVSAGLVLGKANVYECMTDKALHSFFRRALCEINPFVSSDLKMTEKFACDVEERFFNPFLNHLLKSIALNSISKWRARNLPSFKDYYKKNKKIPEALTVGFSYLMYLYKTRYAELQDNAEYIEFFANGGEIRDFKVVDVLDYGDRLLKKGLSLLNGPGNDIIAVTNLMAAGVHMILFTTGRGTPLGGAVPTVKISTNYRLAREKKNWIDFDASPILGGTPMEELTDKLLDYVIEVAGGRQTKNEINGYREISIFKEGVTL